MTVVPLTDSLMARLLCTGNGEKDDDAGEWPEFGHVYINHWAIAMMVGKGIYIIFLEGLVQVCASVQNPLADRAIGLCVDHIGE